jgi:glycine C-acetyltransferase
MTDLLAELRQRLAAIRAEGLWKDEAALASPQGARVRLAGRAVINLSSNNYLGLADDPRLKAAAAAAMAERGWGLASVRFICGTQDLHLALEARLAAWLGHEAAILFAAAFDANAALFEPLLGPEDAVLSDALNHASIIDGIRLCKARRLRFAHADLEDLERQLAAARAGGARHLLVATDGVFSMDGRLAPLAGMRALCDRWGAVLMVDDCHAHGLLGPGGRGTPAATGARADIVTGTLGKALGGAIGGFVAGPGPVVELLRQRARPYLFSNALPPAVVGAALAAIDIAEAPEGDERRARLAALAARWRAGLAALGFELLPGAHPIVPVMLGEARRAQGFARALLARGVLAPGFVYPVVPQGGARVRTQMSAALAEADLDEALAAFAAAGREVGCLPT